MTPDLVRRVLWSPPFEPQELTQAQQRTELVSILRDGGARPWQIDLVCDSLLTAITHVPDTTLVASDLNPDEP
jgi:hypothetical protein